ncbi:ABC transporter permease family protein [Caldicoprobacter faecalis]|uniref:carbohydrate ABC transporter permease n=1 Tax=Caldicoprobacter faecalis TaxID=937334 RepID=UPI001160155D|nr:carbohydrate ABC transporter permease [Caldicoprobacter faecalis]
MCRPSLIVIGLLTFIGSWNDFYRPLIFINDTAKMTLPLGMTVLRGMLGTGNQSSVLAGVMLTTVVPFLFLIFGQRYLIEGISIGGLKG